MQPVVAKKGRKWKNPKKKQVKQKRLYIDKKIEKINKNNKKKVELLR